MNLVNLVNFISPLQGCICFVSANRELQNKWDTPSFCDSKFTKFTKFTQAFLGQKTLTTAYFQAKEEERLRNLSSTDEYIELLLTIWSVRRAFALLAEAGRVNLVNLCELHIKKRGKP